LSWGSKEDDKCSKQAREGEEEEGELRGIEWRVISFVRGGIEGWLGFKEKTIYIRRGVVSSVVRKPTLYQLPTRI
jgi:hypothetical protein